MRRNLLQSATKDFLLVLTPALLLILFVSYAEAFESKIFPSKIRPGDAFIIKVRGLKAAEKPSALLNEKPLLFSSCGDDCFVAIGAVDLNSSPGLYRVPLKAGNLTAMLHLSVLKGSFETIHLNLPDDKVSPGPEDIERIKKEADLLNSLWPVNSEKLWEGNFVLPLQNPLSTAFGIKRIINKETVSIHRGLDIKGKTGEEIRASNTGRVVLTEELFFGGKTVVLDHGQGIFTIYMHMSAFNVAAGDIVAKNEIIGLVGSSGRSSGPHLHFGVKVMGINTNPISIIELSF